MARHVALFSLSALLLHVLVDENEMHSIQWCIVVTQTLEFNWEHRRTMKNSVFINGGAREKYQYIYK